MAFNADQLARLTAGQIDYQYKVYVSGPRDSVAMQDIAEGQAYTAFPTTTLNGTLTNASTTITVVSTTGFDASGYILIADDGTNPAEPIRYTGKTSTTFTGLTRSAPVAHLTGTAVSKWISITDRVTTLAFQETLQSEGGTWVAELNGINYDSQLLAQNNACLAMVRWFPTNAGAAWSSWEVFFQGYIGAGQVSDDYRQGAEWSKPVRGIDFYLENADAPARRYGRNNLAIKATVTATTALTNAATIGHSGEVFGLPSLAASNLVDDSLSTVYCSNNIPQTTAGPGGWAQVNFFISEVGFGPVGTGSDGAYFVVWQSGHINSWDSYPLRFVSFANKQATYYEGTDTPIAPPDGIQIYTKDNQQLPEVTKMTPLILCRNREVFESWAGPQQIEVLEWRNLPGASAFVLEPAGDYLQISSNHTGGANTQIRWGSSATATAWAGLGALSYGQAYYRADFGVNNGNNTDWTLTGAPVPGRNAQAAATAHASIAVPPFSITLASNIDNAVTTIPVTAATTGLNQTSGRIQIDSEQIDYGGATSTTLTGCTRGVAGTSPAAHSSGAVVYAVNNGVAHQMEYIGRIGWKRKRVEDDGVLVVPEDFTIWTSQQNSPAYPNDADPSVTTWQGDWTRQQVATDHRTVEWYTPDSWGGALAKHVMIVCERMTNHAVDDGRFLLNELILMRAAGYDPASTAADTGGDIAEQMLTDFGLDSDLIDVDAFGPIGTHLVTSKGRYMTRLLELAHLLGGQVIVSRDNRVRFERSPWHPTATLPEVSAALSRSAGRLVRLQEGRRNVIGQVQLKANNPESGETFTVQWPPVARALGTVMEVERVFYGSENEARYLAQLVYRQANGENGLMFIPAGHGEGFRLGQRVTLTWDMDRAGDLYSGRNFIVTGVSVQMEHPANGPKVCDWSVSLQEYIF